MPHRVELVARRCRYQRIVCLQELFFQLEGDMCVETYEHGKPRPVPIQEGHIFLLPGRIPHSPQRKAGTVGLVLERERLPGEVDGLRWYTADGQQVLYEETFHCTDLGVQLKPVIERFFASECCKTGVPSPPPGTTYDPAMLSPKAGEGLGEPVKIDVERTLDEPVHLRTWVSTHAHAGNGFNPVLYGPGAEEGGHKASSDYRVEVKTRGDKEWEAGKRTTNGVLLGGASPGPQDVSELFLYQIEGSAQVELNKAQGGLGARKEGRKHTMGPGSVLLVPPGWWVKAAWQEGSLALAVTNAAGLRHRAVA